MFIFFFIQVIFSVTSFTIDANGTLTQCTSNDDVITLPNNVKSIVGTPFKDLTATTLKAVVDARIDYVEPGFLSGSNFRTVSLYIAEQYSHGIFAYQYLLEKVEILNRWREIPENTFSGCIKLNSLYFNGERILENFSLVVQGGIEFCGPNAFRDVSFTSLVLPMDFDEAWNFPFFGHTFLRTVTIYSRLPFLVTEMFSGCKSLSLIVHDGETLLENGQLNLLLIGPRNFQTRDVFTGVKIHTVELGVRSTYNSNFFSSLSDVTTLIYHSSFPGENFTVPYFVEFFPRLTTLSIGPYDIMIDNVIDLSYTPLKSFGNSAFANLDVNQVFFSPSTTKIPPYCFDNCAYLNKVVLPFNVDEIPVGCFRGCRYLSSLVINGYELFEDSSLMLYNSGLRRFGNESFRGVYISKIVFASVVSLSDNSFADIDQLTEIEFVTFQVGTDAITSAPFRNTNVSIVKIPKGSFCYSLPSLSPFFWLGTPLQLSAEWSFTNCLPSVPNSSVITGYVFHPNNTYRLVSCNLPDNSITLPDKIKYVSGNAFVNCGATEIIFGSDLESVDDFAFRGSKIVSVTFPEGYTELNYGLFASITTVQNVIFKGPVDTISAFAFYSSKVSLIQIQETKILENQVLDLGILQSVGKDAFQFASFKTLKIPSAIENHGSIGMSSTIERVEFSGSIISIAANLFDGCSSLSSFAINGDEFLTNQVLNFSSLFYLNIGSYAFRGVQIKTLVFHNFIFFHSNAFDGCPLTDLYSVSPIPNLFAIPPQLRHLNSLRNLYMDSVPIISNRNIVYNTSSYNYDAFAELPIVSARVGNLSVSMFDDCTQLTEVLLLNSIVTIPDNCFRGCTSLVSIYRQGGTPHYLLDNKFTTYNFNRIGTNAFFNVQFEYLQIDCSRLSIGDLAFASNKALKIVELWNLGFNGLRIDNGAQLFLDSPNIEIVNYTQVNYCENIVLLCEEVFSGTPLENKTWRDFGCEEDYSFLVFDPSNNQKLIGCETSRVDIILPEHIVTIANMAFSNCGSTELYFQRDSKLTTLEPWAFNNSKFLIVSFPATLTSIPAGLFADQDVIETVIFQGRLTEIPENAFNWARSLWYLEIGSVPVLQDRHLSLWLPTGRGAFVRNRLANITIYVNVEMLCNMFFFLEQVILFNNTIPDQMFRSENTLTHIYYRGATVLYNRVLDLSSINYVGIEAFESVSIGTIRLNKDTTIHTRSLVGTGGDLTINITGSYSFEELRHLLYLPNTIGMNLNSVRIFYNSSLDLSSLTFTSIPSFEFAGTSYTSITLSNSLSQLSEGLFENCSQLRTVVIPNRIVSIPNRIFRNCLRLTTVSLGTLDLLSSNTLNLSVNEVHSSAFASIDISKIVFVSPVFLDDLCFANTNVTSVEFQTISLQSQGSPFNNCTKLVSVKLPSNTLCSSLSFIPFQNLFRGSSLQNSSWTDFGCVAASGGTITSGSAQSSATSTSSNNSDSGSSQSESGLSGSSIALIILIVIIVVIGGVVGAVLYYRNSHRRNHFLMTEEDTTQKTLLGN